MLSTRTMKNGAVKILVDGFCIYTAHDAQEAARILNHYNAEV